MSENTQCTGAIERVVGRAFQMGFVEDGCQDSFTSFLGLVSSRCPLGFEKLIGFDDLNFAHDVLGIIRHGKMNGTFADYFIPRCAIAEAEEQA